MKKIYILLSRTGTLPARVIRYFKGGKYSHTSIALSPETDQFYSFARRRQHNPFVAGFVKEDIHTQIFAKYPEAPCALYSLDISDTAYSKACSEVERYHKNFKRSKYNFFGFIPLGLGIRFKRKFKLTCSQFVALILDSCGEITLPKDPYLMLPNDFTDISGIELIYEGNIHNCNIPSESDTSN